MANPTPSFTHSSPFLAPELKQESFFRTGRGQRLGASEELLLIRLCRERMGSYWVKEHPKSFWIEICCEFQTLARRNYSWQSCRRRIQERVKARKTHLEQLDKGSVASHFVSAVNSLVDEWITELDTAEEARMFRASQEQIRQQHRERREKEKEKEAQRLELAAKNQEWKTRMNNWVKTSTDPQLFATEKQPIPVNNRPPTTPVVEVPTAAQGRDPPLPVVDASESVLQGQLQEVNDKIDRVVENTVSSIKLQFKQVQLQQRRDLDNFRGEIITELQNEFDSLNNTLYMNVNDILYINVQKTLTNALRDTFGTQQNKLTTKVMNLEKSILDLRKDILRLVDSKGPASTEASVSRIHPNKNCL